MFLDETKQCLKSFSKKYNDQKIIEMLNSLNQLKALVIGDAIIDAYLFTKPLGQSAKGTHLAVQYDYQERFLGGSLAISNHVSGLSRMQRLFRVIGKEKGNEDFIYSQT